MLLARLPEEAWCHQQAGAPVERWSVDRELLAQIADHLTVIATESHRYKEPVRIPRPEHLTAERAVAGGDRPRTATAQEVAAFFASRRVRAG